MKNLQSISLLLLLLASMNISAQIVTSKKEAQKKGIYSYTEKQVSQPAATQKSPAVESQVVMTEVAAVINEPVKQSKESRRGPRKTEAPSKKRNNLKSLVTENNENDFEPETAPYLAQQIVNNAMQFEGVRYKGGGTTKDGMDCSGMVYTTFKIFDITLPRSSRDMAANAGREVKLGEARKGDLLFFDNNRSRRGINHVGIVTEITPEGEVLFLHSSTSSGVIISSMKESYYERTFVQANRVIEE